MKVNYSVQSLQPPDQLQRFEGIAFSSCGNIIGLATSDTNVVYLYRRKADGKFEDQPYSKIEGAKSGLRYPHDLAFSSSGGRELLAVAQRAGAICIYEKSRTSDNYGTVPIFEIGGAKSGLKYSDAVAFVTPHHNYLAVCNLSKNSVSFHRRQSQKSARFKIKPAFELTSKFLSHPDGLAFSKCGRWLAVANHGNHTVIIFERHDVRFSRCEFIFGPQPVQIIRDPMLRFPHSVAFTNTDDLVVSNSGANYFAVYATRTQGPGRRWSQSPSFRQAICADDAFTEVNMRQKMEGGPKGLAVHENSVAVCNPEYGVKIFSFEERLAN